MNKIVVQNDIADQIRTSTGPIELVDDTGTSLGVMRRLPTPQEIDLARSRVGKSGPKFSIDELIEKIEETQQS